MHTHTRTHTCTHVDCGIILAKSNCPYDSSRAWRMELFVSRSSMRRVCQRALCAY